MASSVRWTGRTAATLLAVAVAAALLLSGGFPESVYSLLAAAVWLALAAAAVTAGVGRPSAAVWALAALCVWTLLSALWGPAGPALRAAPLVALYAGALWAAEHVEPRVLLRSVWCACVAAATVALAARLGGVAPEAAGPASARLSWPTGYANGLALVSVSGLLLSFAQPRRWAWSGGAICALAALATFSRGGLLAGVVGLVVLAAVRGRVGRRVALAAAAIAAVAAVALAQPLAARFAAPAPDERDARRLLDVSGHGRADLWRVAWEEGLEHPLAGAGGGTWARAYVADTGSPSAPANAHSLPLETWAELGLVGVLLLAAFAVAVAAAARSNFVFLQH
ncbi:MAG TPA: O-antigen ligase family protein, partial [Gaiellaceae bacterium]|nr:O-antigen ligase family protein [Gaiellaceae bacterium]